MKRLTLACLLLGYAASVLAGEWISDRESNCQVWNAAPSPGESIKWSGQCSNGKATGKGVVQWYLNGNPGSRYDGQYRDGHQNGKGTSTWANGSRYEGEWYNGEFGGGFGTLTLVRGDNGIKSWEDQGWGKWIGANYVVQGMFNEKKLVRSCSNVADCKNKEREENAQRERDAREAAARWEKEAPTRRICEAQKQTCLAQCKGVASCGGGSDECGRLVACESSCRDISCN